MTLVFGAFVPNAPFLISPPEFHGVGESAVEVLRGLDVLGRYRPETIVVSSPHWVTGPEFQVNTSARPRQIYDFSGFPPALSQIRYEPEGDPVLARRLVEAGRAAGLRVSGTEGWGLDHGAWAPLLHIAPGARVPVVPLSIQAGDPPLHLRWGEAIRSALEETERRVVFLATGSVVHNFDRIGPDPGARWLEGEAIEREILARVTALDREGLVHFDRRKWVLVQPEGNLGPLFTLLGALDRRFRAEVASSETVFGGVSLSTITFRAT